MSLWRIIPFNKPHGIKISEIENDGIITTLPYKKSNLNHIKGLHACGMATLAEFTTGLMLLRKLDTEKFRIIMKDLTMEYHYQGKERAFAEFRVSDDWLKVNVIEPLKDQEKIDVPVKVLVKDAHDNHLATGSITWQIKDWQKVKTKK